MATNRQVIAKVASPKFMQEVVEAAVAELRKDHFLRDIVKNDLGLAKAQAKYVVSVAALKGAEKLWEKLKGELPWD